MSQRFLDSPTLLNFPNAHTAATFSLPDPHRLPNRPKSQGAIPVSCFPHFSPKKVRNKGRAALNPLEYPTRVTGMFNSPSSQPGFLHRCSLPSAQRKGISGRAGKVFLEIPVPLDGRIPLIPERLCSAQPNKETAWIYRCILREVLPLLHSHIHLLFLQTPFEACVRFRYQASPSPMFGQTGGSGEGPRARRELGLGGYLRPALCRASLGKAGLSLPEHNADLVVIFVSPPAPPRSTPR